MFRRVLLLTLALFWVVMNLLLWRSEFRPEGEPGERIPTEQVFEKILRAPDLSNLEIRQRGKFIGYCRVSASQAEQLATGQVMSETAPLEGEIRRLTSYTLDLRGDVFVGDRTNRYKFYVGLEVGTNLNWNLFTLQLSHTPHTLSLTANATNQTLGVSFKDGDFLAQREFTFTQLRQPRLLATELGGPLAGMLIGGATAALPGGWQDPQQLAGSFRWEARNDRHKISQGYARVYRLQTDLGERTRVVVIVSRVGEILKIELPHGITLVNEDARY